MKLGTMLAKSPSAVARAQPAHDTRGAWQRRRKALKEAESGGGNEELKACYQRHICYLTGYVNINLILFALNTSGQLHVSP